MTFVRVVVVALLAAAPQVPAPDATGGDALVRMAATERAFAAATGEVGIRDGFLTFLTPDAIDIAPVDGALAIVNLPERLRGQPPAPLPLTRKLLWEPRWGAVSTAGDLGWLTGPYRNASVDGAADDRHGAYFSIWRRQPDGTYKVRLDIGIATARAVVFPDGFTRATPPAAPPESVAPATAGELRAVEARFAQAALTGVGDAYRDHLQPDARLHRNERSPFAGADAAAAFMASTFDRMTWAILHVEVAASGDLAFTAGSYDAVASASEGRPQSAERGFFVRVWQRAGTGAWKIAFETNGIR